MTRKEIDLTVKMLEAYSDYHLSPAGCNDTPDEWLAPFTEEERVTMNREFAKYNGDPEEDRGSKPLPDFCYVGLMKHKLIQLADMREMLLSLCGSLTLCDHMGDVSNKVDEVMKRLGMPQEVLDADWDDLGRELGKLGIKTLYGTDLYDPEESI
jgi:hypothetical protein